jgi:hypothetical protein
MQDEATHKNILAIKAHSEQTRIELREMQEIVIGYENTLKTLVNEMNNLKTQMHNMQVRLYSGGPTE